MKRNLLPMAIAVSLAVGWLLATLALHGWMDRSTPRRLGDQYVASAIAGDLETLEGLAPSGKIGGEVEEMGRRYRAEVGRAFERVISAGAAEARLTHEALEAAEREARSAYWKLSREERPEDMDPWIRSQAIAVLDDGQRRLVDVGDAGITTAWSRLLEVVGPAWRALSRYERRQTGWDAFVASQVADLPAEERDRLLSAGMAKVEDADRTLLAEVRYEAWRDGPVFVDTHGRRLLAAAYAAHYLDVGRVWTVERSAPEARLFASNAARVTAAHGAKTALRFIAERREGKWAMEEAADLTFAAMAETDPADLEGGE